MSSRLTFKVNRECTLKDFLLNECGVSKRLMTKLKRAENGITVNDVHARVVDSIHAGDVVRLNIYDDGFLEPNPGLYVPVVFENDGFVVYDKPMGMPVHPSIKHQGDTLGNRFAADYPGLKFRPVNRLDRDTSGLCVIAKNPYYAAALQKNIEKTYYAVVQGRLSGSGTIDLPIARERDSIIKRVVRSDGQRAVTHYKAIDGNDRYTLLEIKLETGRTHQIRVHFSHEGYPLAGDDLYGGDRTDITGQALHCGELIVIEPVTGEKINIKSDIRKDMADLIKKALKGGMEIIMEKIASFQVDHRKISVGMYISRVDGDIVTYDIRMVKPNGGVYIENPSLHTIEHLFATYARSSEFKKGIIYVGPMGCRTGFYLLTRGLSHEAAIKIVKDAYKFISEYDDRIPGCSEEECGNYKEHNLAQARKDVLPLLDVLENYTVEMLDYSWHVK